VRPQDAPLVARRLDLVVGQPRGAQAQRPLGPRIVLRLDGAQPGDDVGCAIEFRSRQVLAELAPAQEAGFG
jgi:hypothetical protein